MPCLWHFVAYFPKCQPLPSESKFHVTFKNQSEAYMTWGLFWGSPGKTVEQTAASQKISSSHPHPNSGSPHPHAPTDAGSWTASLFAPQSSAPVGTQTTAHVNMERHTTHWWFTGKQELHHLILTPAGDATPDWFIYSLCWPNLPRHQVTIPTPHYGFLYIEWVRFRNEI